MTHHLMHCQEPWYSFIKSGIKKVEGRKAAGNYKNIKKGDIITFYNNDDKFDCEVLGVNQYYSLEEYLKTETLMRTLPGIKTIEEGIKIYLQWSTREQITKNGFLAIQVKVI